MSRHILVTTDAVGGVWRYSLTLAREWAKAGVRVELAVLGPAPDPAQRAEAGAIDGLAIHVTLLELDWTAPDRASLERVAVALADLARQCGVTSVHLHAPALVGMVEWPGPVIAVLHSCLATWWRAMRDGPPPKDFRWRIEVTADGLRRAEHIVAPSRAFRNMAVEAYDNCRPITVVLNGRDPPAGLFGPASARTRQVLSAGRFWDEGKDVATLDRAAALVDAPVQAAGSFRGPNGQEAASSSLVRLGSLGEPALALAFADTRVFVSTARYEPFGLAVLEAAQCGLALVLSDITSFRELWDGAALFVRPGDAADFASATMQALDNPDLLAANAHARASQYSAAGMAGATLALHHRA
ncbi:glycosyltransferase family 4 protein [Lichenicola cladoniae]|uniref:Glycosyltransferase family 4 protein n=1 Tax=Lichenicola cladoniae TaxID=1484109 RepID=A0A6M8HSH6_9PROT|nr:glycosyltransferase family 4 protein [Lichenicola cladoniae]NPD65464.1 glycosyltransferase family 4 protein [Acetobacteraceae bacterium]QKE91469.1 glycosyltransferase family 4 protein [Lichenicola cladoniae]